jgi:hypothetical protein
VQRISSTALILAAVPVQLLLLTAHLVVSYRYPHLIAWREALPVLYLAVTYWQWLLFAFYISLRTHRRYPVPILMHLPHLLSFLPLMRHIMLAADQGSGPGAAGAQQGIVSPATILTGDTTSLTLAWIHAVVTHCFSLIAAWLWQVRREHEAETAERRRELLPIALYAIALITSILTYAGLDLSFTHNSRPLALGIVQLLLQILVTTLLISRSPRKGARIALVAAIAFSLANLLLLFDQSRSSLGVEIALAATSFTQIFALFVFLVFGRKS